ncbi:proton-conducting transporter membrane subunit [Macrococcoides caseolyticum]|uniref:proton-conducting transporter transmembrane domain-containing protein n=1 Tax=Macrococcoides caseolyticum TaxID=69966 RepID=UPI001F1DC656|nr:proton-conducting transporter membrane subunit [Macrococcus caseolyticus]MCE4956524.1 cation:proton antiporter [Macrococcus caseolyticus]
MNNLLIIPILIPILLGVFTYLKEKRIFIIAMISLTLCVLISGILAYASTHTPIIIDLGGHHAPYGIQLYGDFMSLSFVIVSTIIVIAVLYFQHINQLRDLAVPFILFILAGVNGSFLTADIFNLFVMFEVMLLSSFILIVVGKKKYQFKVSISYVVLNLIGSWVFLIGIGILYRVYGTLNYAHLGMRIAQSGYIQEHAVIVLLFIVVFSLKSALLIFMWLPKSYSVLSYELGALFAALLTKVGVYATIRTTTVIFVPYQDMLQEVLLYMAVATIIIGMLGVIKYREIKLMFCYQIILSIGVIYFGIATFERLGINGAILYTFNDMLIKACLFLIAGLIVKRFGIINMNARHGLLFNAQVTAMFVLFFVFAIGGMPFTGGFPGKLMILQAGLKVFPVYYSIIVVLGTFVGMFSMLRLFISLFFGNRTIDQEREMGIQTMEMNRAYHKKLMTIGILTVITCFIALFAGHLDNYLMDITPEMYINQMIGG